MIVDKYIAIPFLIVQVPCVRNVNSRYGEIFNVSSFF